MRYDTLLYDATLSWIYSLQYCASTMLVLCSYCADTLLILVLILCYVSQRNTIIQIMHDI